jgi:hypothetical protein
MSRHDITDNDGQAYVYGFDRPTSQYFLDIISDHPDASIYLPTVGFDSPITKWQRGTHVHLLEAMMHYGIWTRIPEDHRNAILFDLPIPERKTHPTPIPSNVVPF